MASEKPDQDGFLAVIENKIAVLRAFADSYRAAVAVGALGPGDIDASALASPLAGRPDVPLELPQGALLGKSLPAAVKLYLSAVRKKQTTRELAMALKEGGIESTSGNFENIVTTALNRLKATGEVLRFKDGWGLAELYPASLRSSLTKDSKPTRKATKAVRGRKPVARKSATKAKMTAKKAREPLSPGLEQRINAYLQTRGNEFTTVQELVSQLKVAAQVLNLTLGKMRKAERIEKNPNGLVRLTKKAA